MFLLATIALAAQPSPGVPAAAASDDIVVVGKRRHFKRGLRALLAAQSEFSAHREGYAPGSTLLFLVERLGSTPNQKPIRLYLTNGTRELPLQLADDDSFQLPAIAGGNWSVESDLAPHQIKISALVLSPGSTRYSYRMGDARLECRANWAMAKADASVLEAPLLGMVDAAGGCSSRKLRVGSFAPVRIKSAVVEEGQHTALIRIWRAQRLYAVPVSDPTFSNEARVKIIPE